MVKTFPETKTIKLIEIQPLTFMTILYSNRFSYLKLTICFLSIGWLYFWVIGYLLVIDFSKILNESPGLFTPTMRPSI